MHRFSLLTALTYALVIHSGCGSTSSATGTKDEDGLEVVRKAEKPTVNADAATAGPTLAEIEEFKQIWELYRKKDPKWPLARNRFKARSPGAAQLMAVTFLKYYMEVNAERSERSKELVGIKNEIVAIGAPCAPFLADLMVLDQIKRQDGKYFRTDDITRYDCIDMLERMGGQAVPYLMRVLERPDMGVKGRRLTALALGGTRDPEVLPTLSKMLREDESWQVRADAASGLGKLGDRRGLNPLNQAIMHDKDPAVQKRAQKARRQILTAAARPR